MILGALVAAGLDSDVLRRELAKLKLTGYELDIRPIKKQGFAAVKVDVKLTAQSGHRHLHHIVKIIDDANLAPSVKDRAKRVFTRLAEAEAAVHGSSVEKVHFHEVGAVDAIIDIVGAAIGLELLRVERVISSPIPVGSGTVKCEHGVMPVPAPGTAELLKGFPIAPSDEVGELTTPTGAAILTTLAGEFGPLPAMTIQHCGYGAGNREGQTRPNLLRLFIGSVGPTHDEADQVVVLETNLDDTTGQQIGHAMEALFAAGALDVFTVPIAMKKNRPGVLLSVIAPMDRADACEEVLFSQTSTFGVRHTACKRTKLHRETRRVATRYGSIRIKVGSRGGRAVIASPEYDDCVEVAGRMGIPLRDVMFEAQRAWQEKHGGA